MTAEILRELVQANLAATATILLVILMRRPVRRLFGAQAAYGLWMIPPGAMFAVLFPARTVIQALEARVLPGVVSPEVVTPTPSPVESLPEIAQAPAPVDWTAITLLVWLTGLAVAAGLLALRQRRAMRDFGPLTQHPLNRRIFRAQSTVSSPALLGFLRPRIVLPADFESRFSAREQDMVLAHEHTHLSSGHLWINALVALFQVVNWFNPLIHIGAFFARVDQELACDAAVVERNPGERRTYAEAMLKSQIARMSLPLGCHWPARSSNLIKERVEMLAKPSPKRVRRLTGAGLALTLCLGAGLTAWAAQPPAVRAAASNAASADLPEGAPTPNRTANIALLPPPTQAELEAQLALQNQYDRQYNQELATIDGVLPWTYVNHLGGPGGPSGGSVIPEGYELDVEGAFWRAGGGVVPRGVSTSQNNGLAVYNGTRSETIDGYRSYTIYEVLDRAQIRIDKIILVDGQAYLIRDFRVGSGERAVVQLPGGHIFEVRPVLRQKSEAQVEIESQAAEIMRLLATDPDRVPELTPGRGYNTPNALNRVQVDRLLGSGLQREIGILRGGDELWDLPQLALEISLENRSGDLSGITVPSLDLGNAIVGALARDASIAIVGRQDGRSIEFATATIIGDSPFLRTPLQSLYVGQSTRVDLDGQGELTFRLKELADPTVDPGALERVAGYRRPT